jgi:hypothetical protein
LEKRHTKSNKKNMAVLAELYMKIKCCHAAGKVKSEKYLYLSSTTKTLHVIPGPY